MIGALVPLAVGVTLAVLLAQIIPADQSVKLLYEQMTWGWAVPFILFIALVPGFVEETFFRGYMQRRLLERWSAWVAILVTTVLFALMHIMPHAVVNAFVIGLWLGVLAWRTGSVWPGVFCHAFINGSWNVWQVGQSLHVFSDTLPVPVVVAGCALLLGCFLASIWILTWPRSEIKPAPVGAADAMSV
jgi:membrane protease YdiL (CAAX protease family)